ncbi:hypothetical protein DB30_00002 [Enhygromyxa salina]|uniref:Glycosyltransferase RgtA/B/C/D-like domain-containing protein n=1 Tax=Enhygromyxa salina TaxID=215803 RepID=A0A0C2A7H5_9BACT|nr:hypothetical protein [Enhygromyxa salina]KIG19493.1 hypothetical protein DB30_00002 [Enhygromyxa salina]
MSRAPLTLRAFARQLLARLREHPRGSALALALACTFAFFVGPPAWNQNSRLALTRALVEHGSVQIDDWHVTTGDKSYRDGHFYSDKAPGTSLLAALPYAGFYVARRATGGELPSVRVQPLDPAVEAAGLTPAPEQREPGDVLVYNPATLVALWLCRMFAVSLPTLVAGALFYLLMLRELGGDRRTATWATLAWLLATPALGYACGFYGHQLTADLLIAGFALVVLSDAHERVAASLPILVGALLGWAVLSEYTAAIPVALIVAWASWRRGPRFGAWVCVGGLPWALVLAGYHAWAFGGPLKTGYDFVYLDEFAAGMAVNYGIGRPDLAVLGQLLFGSYRGLFYLSPVLLLAAWGLGLRLVSGTRALAKSDAAESDTEAASREAASDPGSAAPLRRGDLLLAVAIIAWYLLLNSGYYMWDGGASLGPRHAVPMLAFLAVGFGPALRRVPWATAVLGAVACLQIVLITAAGPEAPSHGNPIWAYAVPKLFAPSSPGMATNLGRLLGLPGPVSLLPLVALWWLLWPNGADP